jgi:hypothetical protein
MGLILLGRLLAGILLITDAVYAQTPAAQPCPTDCTVYESFRAPMRLLMDSLPVRMEVHQTDPERAPFAHRTFDEIRAREQAWEMWDAIPPECRRAALGNASPRSPEVPSVEFIARLRADTLAMSIPDRSAHTGAGIVFATLQAVASTPCHQGASMAVGPQTGTFSEERARAYTRHYIACARRSERLIQAETTALLSLPADQINSIIESRWRDSIYNPPVITESDMHVFRIYSSFFQHESAEAAQRFLRRESRRMTFDQKLLLLQMIGAQLLDRYDYARRDQGAGARGAVGLEELFQTSREVVRLGAHSGVSAFDPDRQFDFAGVCRDIASANGQLARALGLRNAYVVAFAVNNSYHTALYVRDPERPDRVYHVDYGEAYLRQAGDARALQASAWDQALVYRVAEPGGRSVMSTASEFGRFLSEAAGLDPSTVDPLARTRAQLVAVDIPLTRSGSQSFRAGVGEDGIGDRHAFVAFADSWGSRTIAPGRASAVLGTRIREVPPDELNPGSTRSMSYIAIALEQHLRPEVQIDQSTTFYSDTSIHGLAMAGPDFQVGSTSASAAFDGDLRVRQEFGLEHQFGRGSIRVRAGAIVSPGTLDIRDVTAPIVPILDQAYGGVDARVPISPELLFFANGMIVAHDEFVARGRAEAGIETEQASLSMGIEGNLGEWSGTDPGFLEGSRRRAIAGFVLNPIPELTLRVSGSMDLEDNDEGNRDITGTGSVEGRF